MTDSKILSKAFKKVESNGYNVHVPMPIEKVIEYKVYYKFLFDHSFARAFWGQEIIRKDNKPIKFKGKRMVISGEDLTRVWQYHLQQMVLEPNPIRYLEKFI